MVKVTHSTHFQVFIHQPGLQRSNLAHLTKQREVLEVGGLFILQMMSRPQPQEIIGGKKDLNQPKRSFGKKKKIPTVLVFFVKNLKGFLRPVSIGNITWKFS